MNLSDSKVAKQSKEAQNIQTAKKLWETSEEFLGIKFEWLVLLNKKD